MTNPNLITKTRRVELLPPGSVPHADVVYVIHQHQTEPQAGTQTPHAILGALLFIGCMVAFIAVCIGCIAAYHYPQQAAGAAVAVAFLAFCWQCLRLASIKGVPAARNLFR